MKRRAYGRWWDERAAAGHAGNRAKRYPELTHLGRWSQATLGMSRLMSEFSRNVRRSIPKPWFKVDPAKLFTHQQKRAIRNAPKSMNGDAMMRAF